MRFSTLRLSTAPRARLFAGALVALGLAATTTAAHDFWLIPDMFAFEANSVVHVSGRQGGGKFPAGGAIPVERVVDVRIIGASSTSKITAMAVEGTSLRLQHKPADAGQYLVVMGLSTRVMRQTPAGLIRFLQLEGGAAEAARLEREKTLAGLDSVIFVSGTYAATITQVGSNGPRAFNKTGGLPVEFVPMNDPSGVRVGDTLHVKVLANAAPVPGIGIELIMGLDSAAAANATVTRVPYTADASGIVHLPLAAAGPVMLRTAYASRKAGGASNEWDVSRTTYVFNVRAKR